jgi:predicted metalloprotease with PDZ domain
MSAPTLRYSLRIADIPGKRLEVRIAVPSAPGEPLRLRMPAWIPGSYLIREFAGHVVGVTAQAGGRAVAVHKEDKATWRVTARAGESLEIAYQVYAPELSVRTNDVSDDHAFVSPGATFMAVEGLEGVPATLRVEAPAGWHAAVALEPVARSADTFYVPDYETLVDSPLEIGPHDVHVFEVQGRRHEVVCHGDGNLDVPRFLGDVRRIVEAEAALFGELPYRRYLFIVHLTHDRSGGLEHAQCCAVAWPKLKFRPEKEYRRFLTLVAHEFFHLWNVKRIRPAALVGADLAQETYTRLLWVFEGITSYYDELIPLRAGLFAPRDFFELLCERIVAEASRPGRAVQSLAESSFDTWIKLYRPTPDSLNSQVSYYERGELVALLLDLLLRHASADERSLDDVMRALYSELGRSGRGLEEDALPTLVHTVTGVDVSEFLREHIETTVPLRFDAALAHVGLRLQPKPRDPAQPESGWLGLRMENGESPNRVAAVLLGGPAHAGGLTAGDEIVALNGHRVGSNFKEQIELFRPGETATWAAFRRDRLAQGTVIFGRDPNPPLEIIAVESPSVLQCRSFARWSAAEWPFDPGV